MDRRNFLKKSTVGSSLFTVSGVSLFSQFSGAEMNLIESHDLIDPIIPINYFPDHKEEMISSIIKLRKEYGFRRFLLTGPSKEYRYLGFPKKEVFIDLAKEILDVKKELLSYDIMIGWWCATTIRIGNGRFQSIIREDGSIAEESPCPLDQSYKEIFSDYIGTVSEIARPFWINFEDDFHLNGGCYCPLHLNEFSKSQKRSYSREELRSLLMEKAPKSHKLKEDWNVLKRDSLAGLAFAIREKVDEVAPETRVCLCQSGNSERDGNFTQAVALAFAGKTRPAVRVFGSSYLSDDPLEIPKHIFNSLYQREHLPADFELFHESDTFPHTRFFMSSSKLKCFMIAAFAYGIDEPLLYINQYLENPLEEEGYREMYKKESNRFSALKMAVKGCKVEGCGIYRKPGTSYNWINITGRLGIPHTSLGGKVKLISGNIIEQLSDGEIVDLLKGSVFLDGEAAFIMSKRGFSDLIGAELSSRKETILPPFYEGVKNPENYENIDNRLMYNYVWAFAKNNKNAFYEIKALADTEVITEYLNSRNEPFYPAMTRYKNKLGGRVAIMSFNLDDSYVNTRSISLFNYTKKELMRQVIEWLGEEKLPVFIKDIPNAFCIYSHSVSKKYAVVVVTGLNSDTFDSFTMAVSTEWKDARVQMLNQKGKWRNPKIKKDGNSIKVNAELSVMNPVVLKLSLI